MEDTLPIPKWRPFVGGCIWRFITVPPGDLLSWYCCRNLDHLFFISSNNSFTFLEARLLLVSATNHRIQVQAKSCETQDQVYDHNRSFFTLDLDVLGNICYLCYCKTVGFHQLTPSLGRFQPSRAECIFWLKFPDQSWKPLQAHK